MCSYPKVGYEKVSKKLVNYCGGHPMALQVLGRSLYNRDVTYWEGYIDKLTKENDSPITHVLRMSFDSLPSENDKELFKHIACFFVGMDKEVTLTILEACDIETRSGITNLIDRCLVSIRWSKSLMVIELMMHQLVQEMGRFVVRKESLNKPCERSRLWGYESFTVLKQKKGTENVLGITLDTRMLEKEKSHRSLELKTDAFSNMDNLMLLQLNYVQINGSYENFPEELRWLCMHGFSQKSLPSDLLMENLIALDMSFSNIESFGIYYCYPQWLYKTLKQWTGLCLGLCLEDKRFLGALKILNLRIVGGFDNLPKLERLILRGCKGLLEVCESIGQCAELVYIDLTFCNKLGKLPRSLGKLEKVKTLLLQGCNLGRMETRDMDSTEELMANNNGNNTEMSSSAVVEAIPSDLKFFTISLPRSLVRLSLIDNNLSTESFPMDFSTLFMLKELYLDFNPIDSMPSCVRTLPRIERLSLVACNMLTSVEDPPLTLNFLQIYVNLDQHQPMLRRVLFDPQIRVIINKDLLACSSFEYEQVIKIQPLEGLEENVLRRLGWTELDFLIGRRLRTLRCNRPAESEIQIYYEFGIFSTIYEGEEMPNWITDRREGESISFTIPATPEKLTGLNFCCVLTFPCLDESRGFVDDFILDLTLIRICNVTKKLTWIYRHFVERVSVTGNCVTLLSHWMFGMNQMEAGDIIIATGIKHIRNASATMECGVSLVYDDGEEEEEEDALDYYKSWNCIIGKGPLQVTTGGYYLNYDQIMRPDPECNS